MANRYEEFPGITVQRNPSQRRCEHVETSTESCNADAGRIPVGCGEAHPGEDGERRKPLRGSERSVCLHRCARLACYYDGLLDERRVAVAVCRASHPRHI